MEKKLMRMSIESVGGTFELEVFSKGRLYVSFLTGLTGRALPAVAAAHSGARSLVMQEDLFDAKRFEGESEMEVIKAARSYVEETVGSIIPKY